MRRALTRLRWRWRTWRNTSGDLNRRVDVERVLWDVVSGDRAPLGPDDCRALALKLGIPDELREARAPRNPINPPRSE